VQIVEVALEPTQSRRPQRGIQSRQGVGPVGAVSDQLGQHRIVVGTDLGASLDPGVHPYALRKLDLRQGAGRRLEVLCRILRIEPGLDGVAPRLDRERVQRREFAGAELHHPFDDVDAGHRLGDAVLDLQSRIDLEEEEFLGPCVDDELHRTRRAVRGGGRDAAGRCQQRRTHLGPQVRCWSLFDHLLVAPLQRAVTLSQRDHLTESVAEDLYFDVARVGDVALEEDACIREVGQCQSLHRVERGAQGAGVGAHLHADATATGAALEHHRIADALGGAQCGIDVRQQPGAGQQGHARLQRQRAGRVLEPEHTHLCGCRSEEYQPGSLAGFDEGRVLGQEAVAGMDRLGPRLQRGVDQRTAVQVAARRRGRTDANRDVSHRHVHRVGIGLRVDRHRTHAHSPQRADDPAGDGSAVGDQDSIEHGLVEQGGGSSRGHGCGWSSSLSGAEGFNRGPRSGNARAWGCSRCTGCSAGGSWRRARSRPSRHASPRICRAPRSRPRRSAGHPR
jgi:hypothetical protein